MTRVSIALVGAGPWGLTVARALGALENVELRWIGDLDDDRRHQAARAHPGARITGSLDELLSDRTVDAVAVAVDPRHQHEVGLRVLQADRHLLLEKPMALSADEATTLVSTAQSRGRLLVVGYLLLHHPAVRRARQIIADGALGNPLYFEGTRIAPGTARARQSAWWTLAPHDISLALHLFGDLPVSVSATGGAFIEAQSENVAFATLRFADGRLAHIDVARIAAEKKRQFSVAGTRRALTFDELDLDQPLRIHATNGEVEPRGAEALPVDRVDPLSNQCRHFVGAVGRGDLHAGNGAHALNVVRVLEAGAKSMRANGAPVDV